MTLISGIQNSIGYAFNKAHACCCKTESNYLFRVQQTLQIIQKSPTPSFDELDSFLLEAIEKKYSIEIQYNAYQEIIKYVENDTKISPNSRLKLALRLVIAGNSDNMELEYTAYTGLKQLLSSDIGNKIKIIGTMFSENSDMATKLRSDPQKVLEWTLQETAFGISYSRPSNYLTSQSCTVEDDYIRQKVNELFNKTIDVLNPIINEHSNALIHI